MKYYYPIIKWGVLIVFLMYQLVIPPSIASAQGDLLNRTIAGIDVDGKKASDIESQLASEVERWKENDIIVQASTGRIIIPSNYINFDIKDTVKQYIEASSKPWYLFLASEPTIQLALKVSVDDRIYEALNEAPLFIVDETIEAILLHAGYLQQGPVEALEVPLTKDLLTRISFETQEMTVNITGLSQMVLALNDTTLLNGESFSFLEKLTEADSFYNNETANFVASTLYSAVLKSEMDIQERHSQHSVPNYLAPGIEVKVDAKRKQDFAFVNNSNRPVIIYASTEDNRLLIELYSFKSEAEVTYTVSKKEIVTPRTVYRLTSTLPAGQEEVLEQGKDGVRVEVSKRLSIGSDFKDQIISRDFYPPTDTVIAVSSLTPPVSLVVPGDGIPIESQDDSTVEPEQGSQTTPGKEAPVAEGQTKDEVTFTDENGKPIPEGATYDKGGNLITSDPQ